MMTSTGVPTGAIWLRLGVRRFIRGVDFTGWFALTGKTALEERSGSMFSLFGSVSSCEMTPCSVGLTDVDREVDDEPGICRFRDTGTDKDGRFADESIGFGLLSWPTSGLPFSWSRFPGHFLPLSLSRLGGLLSPSRCLSRFPSRSLSRL